MTWSQQQNSLDSLKGEIELKIAEFTVIMIHTTAA